MAHPLFARLLLSGLATSQGLATLKIDLHRSHATNPLWPKHARFHVVWQVLNLALLALFETALVWWPGQGEAERFYVASYLISITFLGFWGACASMRLYGGALFDPNGILPWKVRLGERILALEMNVIAVALGAVLLVIAVACYR